MAQLDQLDRDRCLACGELTSERHRKVTDRLYATPGAWDYRLCGHCQSVTISPVPDGLTLDRAYERYHTHSEGTSPRSSWYPSRRSGAYWSTRRERGTPAAFAQAPGKCLDVGCGSGDALRSLVRQGWECYGTETDPAAARRARESGAIILETTIRGLSAEVAGFDLVILNHVVEHLTKPRVEIALLAEKLRPGGILQLATPNAASTSAAIFGKRWRGLEAPRHICVFSERGLRELGAAAGLSLVECTALPLMDGSLFVGSVFAGTPPTSQIRTAVRRLMNWTAQNVFERFVPPGRGGELVAVFEKPALSVCG